MAPIGPSGGQNVRQKHETLVGRTVRNLDRRVLRLRDAQQLSLAARDGSIELREAEQRGPHPLLTHLCRLALRVEVLVTHEAVPAGDLERHDDTVTDRDVGHRGADLFDDSHRLMTEDVTLAHERPERLIQMQV